MAGRKGLTYRSYGEYAARSSDGTTMPAAKGADALFGHVPKDFKKPGMRDTQNVDVFLREFEEYEKNIDNPDANKRLPNYVVMSLAENHTVGTRPGGCTLAAMVASNDFAVGTLVDKVSHSKYWATTAIFIIEDDAQDGPDHVDARRTVVGLLISPYVKRKVLHSTLYTTSSMLPVHGVAAGSAADETIRRGSNPDVCFLSRGIGRPVDYWHPRRDPR